MISQTGAFMFSAGDHWFHRNREKMVRSDDRILSTIEAMGLKPKRVLEIGCSNGWRLDAISRKYSPVYTMGIEPSKAAVAEGQKQFEVNRLERGMAHTIDAQDTYFDLVIYGFCLYLCDRDMLFKIAAEGDRVLRPGGRIIVMDFHSESPYSRTYAHDTRLRSFKMNYSTLWTWNPIYTCTTDIYGTETEKPLNDDDRVAVHVLTKSVDDVFPVRD